MIFFLKLQFCQKCIFSQILRFFFLNSFLAKSFALEFLCINLETKVCFQFSVIRENGNFVRILGPSRLGFELSDIL